MTGASSIEPVRLAYVGCGFMAQKVHIPNFAALPNARLLALAEVREDLGRAVAARYGVPKWYRSHEELCADGDIEAAGVSAGFVAQAKIARDLLRAGKHVFMEKPMAVSLAQADELLAAARAGNARLMVGYMKRYDAGNELFKARLDQARETGELGPVLLARNHGFCGDWIGGNDVPLLASADPKPPEPAAGAWPEWLPAGWQKSYLGYLQQWTHNINLLRWFLEAPGAALRMVDLDADGMTGITVLDLNGTRGVIESGGLEFHRWEEHTQVYFKRGWLRTEAPPLLSRNIAASVELYRAGNWKDDKPAELTQLFPRDRWTWSYQREAAHFIGHVRSGEPFRSSGEDTRHDVRLCEEIYRAFLQRRGEL